MNTWSAFYSASRLSCCTLTALQEASSDLSAASLKANSSCFRIKKAQPARAEPEPISQARTSFPLPCCGISHGEPASRAHLTLTDLEIIYRTELHRNHCLLLPWQQGYEVPQAPRDWWRP